MGKSLVFSYKEAYLAYRKAEKISSLKRIKEEKVQENQAKFYEKLIKFYGTGNNDDLKQWIYDTSIDGIDLNNNKKYF